VETNRNDFIDAEPIAEAAARPRMRFVPIKTTQHFLDQFGLANLEELYPEGRIEKLFDAERGSHRSRPLQSSRLPITKTDCSAVA
jgi:chromosome segregation and condensation protein ScpB